MPTFETAHYAASKANRANTSRLAPENVSSGNVEWARIKYTMAGNEATNDIIKLCVLPQGVLPRPDLSSVVGASAGTTVSIDVGTAADPDGWLDGIAGQTAGKKEGAGTSTLPVWLEPTPLVPDAGVGTADVYATLVSVSSPAAAGTVIWFNLAYQRGK